MASISASSAHSPLKPATLKTVTICLKDEVQAHKDGVKVHFDQQTLTQGSTFFKSALKSGFHESLNGTVDLSHISYPIFKVVVQFLCEERALSEAIAEKDLTVRFYEDLRDALNFLHPLDEPNATAGSPATISPSQARENQIKEVLPYLVTYEQATTILTTFREKCAVSSSSSSEKEVPFLVKVAHSIIFQSVTFSTKKLASEHFHRMREAQIRKDQAQAFALHFVKPAKPEVVDGCDLPWKNVFYKDAPVPWEDELDQFQQRQIAEESALLSTHAWKKYPECLDNLAATIEKISPKMNLICSSYLDDADPFIREIAALAKQRLVQEIDTTVAALLLSGIDLSKNPTLRDYLVGPKANLLAYYDISVVKNAAGHSSSQLPFRINNNTPWTCDFNQSLKAVEDEIRQDLTLMGYELEPRLIEKDEEPSSQPVKGMVQHNVVVQALHEFKTKFSSSGIEYAEDKKVFLGTAALRTKTNVADCIQELHTISRKNRFMIGAKSLSGRSVSIKIELNDTVASLKKKIIEKFEFTKKHMSLLHMGKYLTPDTRMIHTFGLKVGDMVYVQTA